MQPSRAIEQQHCSPMEIDAACVRMWESRMRGRLTTGTDDSGGGLRTFQDLVRVVHGMLHEHHGTPHLGNWQDPTDEFVYIILSRKTPEKACVRAFEVLQAAGDWGAVATLSVRKVARLIHGCGLEHKKAVAILAGLKCVTERFGEPDLSLAKGLPDDELFALLTGLPEVGPKSARCVMLYSFRRTTFPVDAHVGRILARLGCMQLVGIDLAPMGHKARQRALEDAIPPDLRYGLHVNLVAHGREVCGAHKPDCERCTLQPHCDHGRA